MQVSRYNYKSISFGRELTPIENITNRCRVYDAKKAIGLDHIVLVTHTPCLPSEPNEDNGIGVLASTKGTLKYLNFAYDNGIDGISIEPQGVIKGEYYCPYDSSSFSKKVVVNLNELTTDKWACILPESVAQDVVKNKNYNVRIPQKDGAPVEKQFSSDRVIYDYVLNAQLNALHTAYDNFQTKIEAGDTKALELNKTFEDYKQTNNFWLETDSLYFTLSKIHSNDYYLQWDNKLHQTLFDKDDTSYSQQEKDAEKAKLIKENPKEIDFYKFCQFVVNKQQIDVAEYASNIGQNRAQNDISVVKKALEKGEINSYTAEYLIQGINMAKNSHRGVNIIGDKQIGFSTIDIWGHPDVFTKDEFMGAPPNPMKKRDAQSWGFKFIPREKLFNENGSLGDGGIFLKNLFVKTFRDNPGGVRIDHVLGMIDPWTYKNNAGEGSRYLFKLMLSNQLKELQDVGINEEVIKGIPDPINGILEKDSSERKLLCDKGVWDFDKAKRIINENEDSIKKEYARILSDIVLVAGEQVIKERAETLGETLDPQELNKKVKSLLICEDMGVLTTPLLWTMKALELTGMRHARYSDPLNSKQIYRESNPEEQGHYWMVGGHDDAPYIRQVSNYDKETIQKDDKKLSARDLHADYVAQELDIKDSSPLRDRNNPWTFIKAKFARIFAADKNPKTPNNILLNWQDMLGIDVQYNKPGTADKENNWNARIPNQSDSFDKTYYNQTLPSGTGISITETLKTAMQAMGDQFIGQNRELIQSLSVLSDKLKEKAESEPFSYAKISSLFGLED
jgi:4-alpha-glucanotransferase